MLDEYSFVFQEIINFIKNWNPPEYSREKEYQKDLYNYLKDLQDNRKIKADRMILRERGKNNEDLVIDDTIGIELKKDIRHQSGVDRAVAQIKRMKNEYNYLLLIIVGKKNSRQHVDLLKHEIKEFLEGGFLKQMKSIKVIQIKSGERKKEQKGFLGDFGDLI